MTVATLFSVNSNACRAGDAGKGCRIEIETRLGDVVAAFLAESEFAFIDAPKGRIDFRASSRAPAHCRLCHGLALHGVHATEAANRLLVQHDRAAAFG